MILNTKWREKKKGKIKFSKEFIQKWLAQEPFSSVRSLNRLAFVIDHRSWAFEYKSIFQILDGALASQFSITSFREFEFAFFFLLPPDILCEPDVYVRVYVWVEPEILNCEISCI